ncbi:MAG: formyltetrahydrofolate deformylase, partial [Daejeonella sp.]|nr:formyltetrahydrofolate deformylase [Daejeonella sp.]
FFTRIECQGNPPDVNELNKELTDNLPANSTIRINPKQEKSLAILVTKEYHCLGDTLTRHFFNTLNANVCCVIGNYTVLEAFTKKFEVPFHYISHQDKSHEEFEYEILEILEAYKPDYVVLAKFMRILSPKFVASYAEKIINIHHSFLPAFMGANPYRQAHERGVKIIGATAHFVTNDLDEGPIISQKVIPVNHTFTAKDMVVAGKEIEKSVLSTALQLVLQDRVFISGNRTILFE